MMEPQTPSRDPSAIDRQGLVGVGELATPRWASDASSLSSAYPKDSPADIPTYDPYAKQDITPSWGTSIFNDLKSLDDLPSSVNTSNYGINCNFVIKLSAVPTESA